MLLRSTTALAVLVLAANAAQAKDIDYVGTVETIGEAVDNTARGRVFEDLDRNSAYDEGEPGIEGVTVSNGRETATTDAEGRWELPGYADINVFATKPAGYAVPVDEVMGDCQVDGVREAG